MKKTGKTTENSHLIVSAGKSSRLDAIRRKAGLLTENTALDKKSNLQKMAAGLNLPTKEALQQARGIIEETMLSIMNSYPAGKKNTFFKLRHGIDEVAVKTLLMKDVFKLLKLDTRNIKNFQLIEKLNWDGKSTDAK